MTDFAKDVRERWKAAEEADKDNRDEALEDLKFEGGEQWDERVREYRESTGPFPLPCLTNNTLPQLVNQVVGDWRANQTSIKVLPREDGDVQVADVRSELIRSIELQSKVDRVYPNTFAAMVSCGISNMRVDLEYAYEDAFERDLFIRAIPNPLAVQWDPFSGDPTGRDATYCFVGENILKDEFRKRFPDAKESSLDTADMRESGWVTENSVRIAEYWKITEKPRTFALMQDGAVEDVTDQPEKSWKGRVFIGPDGKPRIRQSKCKYASMVLTNGFEELSDPFELKLPRLPIIRCTGREVWIGDRRVRFGLVRFARDPQRLKNYFRSVRAELLMLAPRHNFVAPAAAVKDREADWANTLVYNDDAPAPPQQTTLQNLAALLSEEEMCANDMKETTGIYDAKLGNQGNETSGVAIRQRQQQGDLATIIYHQNMDAAIQEVGEVLNALIPIVYDTPRTIRTVGADEGVKLLRVNDPTADQHIDLSTGRYDVTITTGPSYATRRQESAAQLMELAGQAPQITQAAGDLIIQEMDLVNGDKIAERIKRAMDPAILGDDADDDLSDEEKAQKQAQAQQAQQMQQMQVQLQMEAAQAETALKVAQAKKAEAEAMKAQAEAQAAAAGPEGPSALEAAKVAGQLYDAHTRRLSALGKNDFALPPEAVAVLAPAVTEAVLQALGAEHVPGIITDHIAAGAYRDGINERTQSDAATQSAVQAANQPPEQPEDQAA
jgi:hypothetical protein